MRYYEIIETVTPKEDWSTYVEIFGVRTNVGWRLDKDARNRRRHKGLSLRDGIPIIDTPDTKAFVEFVKGEERQINIGFFPSGRALFVVIC